MKETHPLPRGGTDFIYTMLEVSQRTHPPRGDSDFIALASRATAPDSVVIPDKLNR